MPRGGQVDGVGPAKHQGLLAVSRPDDRLGG
ncbi:hypothetical protein GA0074696_0250 [Micromonospora purpureochromogenes]|uniref:Uncharacterized protein n=1 Tax=Micromonospora purpureochromogenes TaxID=47872 RepID=A0A1C4UBH1_9ACTN|nr:hypothetical protein GA0074696_0250 [Micromonospora purpureochromogenes]